MPTIFKHPTDLLSAEGMNLGSTEWIEISQERVNTFADATDDHQWIHIDQGKAANGPFGACIAHGFLTLSLASKFMPDLVDVQQSIMGINYGCDRVRFPNTVKIGQRIRARGEIQSAEQKPSGVQAVIRITIDVEGEDKPACVADNITRFYYEPA